MIRRHLVSTPIGCLDDISTRAKTILQFVSMILAEDTRTTGLLLNRFVFGVCLMFHRMEISNRMESLNQENEQSKIPMILTHLKEGRMYCIGIMTRKVHCISQRCRHSSSIRSRSFPCEELYRTW